MIYKLFLTLKIQKGQNLFQKWHFFLYGSARRNTWKDESDCKQATIL